MATWDTDFPIFPDYICASYTSVLEHKTDIVVCLRRESRASLWIYPRRAFTISGSKMLPDHYAELEGYVEKVKGMAGLGLFYDEVDFKIHKTVDGVDIPSVIDDHTDGLSDTYQITKTYEVQGRTRTVPVRFIDHDFPALESESTGVWRTSTQLRVFLNDVEVDPETYTVHRAAGTIEFDSTVPGNRVMSVIGFYYVPVRLTKDSIPTERKADVFTVGSGFGLIEPKTVDIT